MKNKTIATILALTTAISCACAGCDKDSVMEQSNVTSDSDVVVIPDSVKAKLKSAVEAKPVPIPENGWTDEALLDTVRINGEKINFPFCLNDLGEAFTVKKSELQQIKDGKGSTEFEYYDKNIGIIFTVSTSDLNNIANDEIQKIDIHVEDYYSFKDTDVDYSTIKGEFPISVNGVTIGSNFDEIYEKLGFVDEDAVHDSDENGSFLLSGRTENYDIVFQGKNMIVKRISISYRKNEEE